METPAPVQEAGPATAEPEEEYRPTFEMTEPEPEPVATVEEDPDPLGIRAIMARAEERRLEALAREAEAAVEVVEAPEPTLGQDEAWDEPETAVEAAETPEPTLDREEAPEPPEDDLAERDIEELELEAQDGDELAREELERMAEGQDVDGDGIEDHGWQEYMRRLEEVRAEMEALATRSHDALDQHQDHLVEALEYEGYMWTPENGARIELETRLADEARAELEDSERERDAAVKRAEELVERLLAMGVEVPQGMVAEADADLHRHVAHIHAAVADHCHHEGQADLAAKHLVPAGTTGGERSEEQRRIDEEEAKRLKDRMEAATQRPGPAPGKK